MQPEFLDGTIAFAQGKALVKGWEYELSAQFSEGVGQKLRVSRLNALQAHCNGQLDIERLPCGNMRMTRAIIAHGAESACRQAHDLQQLLLRTLGLRTNVAFASVA